MKRCLSCSCLLALLLPPLSERVSADILYDNGPISGTQEAWQIGRCPGITTVDICTTADSFNLSSRSTLTGVTLGLWVVSGDLPLSLDWSIWSGGPSVDTGGTELTSGAGASLDNTLLATNNFGFDIYRSTFSLGSVSLDAGTYWLDLTNAVESEGFLGVAWDQNNGPLGDGNGSQAWVSAPHGYTGFLTAANLCGGVRADVPLTGFCSESFQVLGTNMANVPEPGNLRASVLAASLLALLGLRRIRRANS